MLKFNIDLYSAKEAVNTIIKWLRESEECKYAKSDLIAHMLEYDYWIKWYEGQANGKVES